MGRNLSKVKRKSVVVERKEEEEEEKGDGGVESKVRLTPS